MLEILPGADLRGYYEQLGVHLTGWSKHEAPARCFAEPDAHAHGDRNPSTSVNLTTGLWHCHGCGAKGNALQAALACGYTPISAFDLMIRHGLIDGGSRLQTARELMEQRALSSIPRASQSAPIGRKPFVITEAQVHRWAAQLERHKLHLHRLRASRGWELDTLRELQLGLDRDRITIPIRNETSKLQGLLRYQPDGTSRPKMLASPGSRLGLIPHPASEPAEHILLVEGPPDMITARSCGANAIAVPGDHAWQPSWAQSLAGRHITIDMDCDLAGRQAAERIARDLFRVATTQILDLAPDRDDGYDLTDWLLDSRKACSDGEARRMLRSGLRNPVTLDIQRRTNDNR